MAKRKSKVKNSLSKLLLTIILLSIVTVLGYFFYLQRNFLVNKNQDLATLVTYIKTDQQNSKLYTISAEYPLFDKTPEEFNNLISSTVTNKITEFKKNATSNWEERRKMPLPQGKIPEYPETPFSFILTWSAQELNTNYISFTMRVVAFEGGANERQEIIAFNYDLKKGRQIKLAHLFPNNPDYLEYISKYAKDDLTQQFENTCLGRSSVPQEFIEAGTSPKEKNFKTFTFDKYTINFYFPKYQVAPGAYGEQHVSLPRDLK